MKNLTLSEEAIHRAAQFLERYEDKAPNKEHQNTCKEFREVSNFLIENLGRSAYITVIRHK